MLLRREALSVSAALERLVGMQAQVPHAPYVGLWSRLADFTPAGLSRLLTGRKAVRTALMRNTLHLVTATDCLILRSVLQPMLTNVHLASPFGRRLAGVDQDALVAAGRALVLERPRSIADLGKALQGRWPDRDAESLGYAMRSLLPLVQIPPRGVWGASGPPVLAAADAWIGRPLSTSASPDAMIRRYLAAFGPATVADVRAWSGMAGMQEAIDRLRPRLRLFRDERGRELFDVPDGLRPRSSVAAPVRFLPEYDNVLVAYADRSRIIPPEHRALVVRQLGGSMLLVDGFVRGMWRIDRSPPQRATLTIELLDRVPALVRSAIEREGRALLTFAAADAKERTVTFG